MTHTSTKLFCKRRILQQHPGDNLHVFVKAFSYSAPFADNHILPAWTRFLQTLCHYCELSQKPKLSITNMGAIWWGTRGTCPPLFRRWGYNMLPTLFSLQVLYLERFQIDGRPHIAKLILKQSLLWYHWVLFLCKF